MESNQNQTGRDLLYNAQRSLPNSTAIFVLGLLSLLICFICGIAALIMAGNDERLYRQNPESYTSSSYDLLKAGRILSIISLCLWGVGILFYVAVLVFAISFAPFS
ncbi:MAG TPA: hypothetical protein VGD33_06920 [Chitinophagaceae bacterium]